MKLIFDGNMSGIHRKEDKATGGGHFYLSKKKKKGGGNFYLS